MPPVPESHRLNKHTFFSIYHVFVYHVKQYPHNRFTGIYAIDLENVLAVGYHEKMGYADGVWLGFENSNNTYV